MGLPERLKELRKDKGLTQKELAEVTGLSIASIVSYENGLRKPNFNALTILEDFFEVSGEYLNGTITKQDYLKNQNDVQKNLDSIYVSMQNFSSMMKTLDSSEQIYITELFNSFIAYISHKENIDFNTHNELALFNVYTILNDIGKHELVNRGNEMCEVCRYFQK